MCNGNRNYKGMRRRELLIIGLGTSLSSSNFVEEVRKTVGLLVAVLGTPIKKKKGLNRGDLIQLYTFFL